MPVRKRNWFSAGVEREAWVVDYVNSERIRRLKTFRLKKEADAFRATATKEVQKGAHLAERTSVVEFIGKWLWQPNSVNKYGPSWAIVSSLRSGEP